MLSLQLERAKVFRFLNCKQKKLCLHKQHLEWNSIDGFERLQSQVSVWRSTAQSAIHHTCFSTPIPELVHTAIKERMQLKHEFRYWVIDNTNEMTKSFKSIDFRCTCTIEMLCFKDVNSIGNASSVVQAIRSSEGWCSYLKRWHPEVGSLMAAPYHWLRTKVHKGTSPYWTCVKSVAFLWCHCHSSCLKDKSPICSSLKI